MFASRGESAGSGIVMEMFSHSRGSSRFVLSSSRSTGVSSCIIFFLDLGWIGVGLSNLEEYFGVQYDAIIYNLNMAK